MHALNSLPAIATTSLEIDIIPCYTKLRNRRYIKASTATARRNVVGASIAAVDKGKKREGVRFKLVVQFKEPGSKD